MKLILGVTGSVAAVNTAKLVRAVLARIPEAEIKVIATERGHYFFRDHDLPREVPVLTDRVEWPADGYAKGKPVPHIDLGDCADLLAIAPLTADTLSDIAHGKADKFLTSVVLAWPIGKPIVLAPAMNTRMWENPITQDNLLTAIDVYGAAVVPPQIGDLACGTRGVGKMADFAAIAEAIASPRR